MGNPVIYRITSPSNKIYIGQTWRWSKRKTDYKYLKAENQHRLHNSIIKYKWINHKMEIIEILPEETSQEELDTREIYWWNHYKGLGFEMLNTREPGKGGRHSEETRRRIGLKHKGKIVSAETRKKLSISATGRTPSRETIEKIIAVRKAHGVKCSEETKLKISESNKGKHGGLTGSSNYNAKKVINISTQQVFGCIEEASTFYNMSYLMLKLKLRGKRNNNTNLRLLKNV